MLLKYRNESRRESWNGNEHNIIIYGCDYLRLVQASVTKIQRAETASFCRLARKS